MQESRMSVAAIGRIAIGVHNQAWPSAQIDRDAAGSDMRVSAHADNDRTDDRWREMSIALIGYGHPAHRRQLIAQQCLTAQHGPVGELHRPAILPVTP